MERQLKVKTYREAQLLSVVVPVFNEAEVLPNFHYRLSEVLAGLAMNAEILYVNDGSTDASLQLLYALKEDDNRIAIVDLSRNFGKEVAMTAGIDHAQGDAVIVIDADLQDPPELIPELIQKWQEGYEVVYAQRIAREGETWLKKFTAYSFYRIIQKVGRVHIPKDTGDFRLLGRQAVTALQKLGEQHRFMKGLFAWIGFPQIAVPYRRDARFAGETKYNYWKLWNFALEGITSFTTAPLKIATYIGLGAATFAFLYALLVFYKALFFGDPVKGYPSLMVVILFLGGVQLMTLGVIGEYVGRTFNETKGRPLYFLKSYIPPDAMDQHKETILKIG